MAFGWRRRKRTAASSTESGVVPLDNTALVDAMRAVALDDSEQSRAVLFRLLLDARLIVATRDSPPAPVSRVTDSNEALAVRMHQDEGGDLLPLFTSVATLQEWLPQGSGYAVLAAPVLLQMTMADLTARIVIDPGSSPQGTLTRFEIAALASGRLPIGGSELAATAELIISPPSTPPPDDVVQAVRDELDAAPEARAAWLFLQQQEGYAAEMTIGVAFQDGLEGDAEGAAMQRIADGAFARCAGAESLILMSVSPAQRREIAEIGEEIFRR